MLNLRDVQDVRTVITHASCPDGTASALLVKDALPRAEVKFVHHGSKEYENLQAVPNMLFVDFSPPAERAQEFVNAGAMILDHHKSARDVVALFGDRGVFGDEVADPGVCGAVLAYKNIWEPLLVQRGLGWDFVEDFATLAGIRDTWQRQSPRWREANVLASALYFFPASHWMEQLESQQFFMKNKQSVAFWDEKKALGEILWTKKEKSTARNLEKIFRWTSPKGTRCVIFEGTHQSSDTAESLGNEADLVVGFSYSCENGQIKLGVSTRSHTHYNCAELATKMGGGGHTKAAGFSVNLDVWDDSSTNPYAYLTGLITAWERGNEEVPVVL